MNHDISPDFISLLTKITIPHYEDCIDWLWENGAGN